MKERSPGPRGQSVREALREALAVEEALTLSELSAKVRVSERDLPGHLEHLQKSLQREGAALEVFPARCLSCGFLFEGRGRMTRPGKCPECRGRRISQPRFRVA
ncbi:MAG: transcriptional regulator [Alphaproteobacteria bacterium]|nr:transcriptional regulator [Alphaproteobacteria bacterium]